MGFAHLPPELLVHIIQYIHPSTHLNFALTCKVFAKCSHDILLHHQKCVQKQVYTDIRPTEVYELLRNVVFDPILAWHVRCLHYGDHIDHYSGRPPDLGMYDAEMRSVLHHLRDQGEQDRYRELFCRFLTHGRGNSSIYSEDSLSTMLWSGDDDAPKILLYAMCPRLDTLTFVRRTSFRTTYRASHPIWLLSHSIKRILGMPTPVWPPGFQSLCRITIGVNYRNNFRVHPCNVAPLLMLPNIREIHINALAATEESGATERHDTDNDFDLPAGCSTIQRISFAGAMCSAHHAIRMLASANCLRAVLFENCHWEPDEPAHVTYDKPLLGAGSTDDIIRHLAEHHESSLETLVLRNGHSPASDMHNLYRPELLQRLPKLRNVSLHCQALLICCPSMHLVQPPKGTSVTVEMVAARLKAVLPVGVETLNFISGDSLSVSSTEILLGTLAVLMASTTFRHLRLIDVRDLYTMNRGNLGRPGDEGILSIIEETVRLGRQHGIDVITTPIPT